MSKYTLIEASRREQNPLRAGVMEAYGEASDLFSFVPLQSIDGNAYTYHTRTKLPGVAFRGVNESFTPTKGTINPQTEQLKIAGGEIDLDTFLVRTQPNRTVGDLQADEVQAQGTAMGKFLARTFIKGDETKDPREFDGLQRRLIGNQLVAAKDSSPSSAGDPLTLAKVDELVDAVVGGPGNKVLLMNRTMRRKINTLVRAAGQATEVINDEFGRQRYSYAGVPISELEEDHLDADILAFDEAGPGGGTASTSIYCVRFGTNQYVSMLQNGSGMIVNNLGELQSDPKFRVRVEWYLTLAVFHGRSAARLWGISNA